MGDSATPRMMRSLRDTPGIEMMNFRQAAGYVRKFRFLSRLTLPEGAMDLGKNHPPRSYELVGPTVELVARKDLHPALSDLLIGAAREVHGRPGLFRDAGQYPAPLERDFPISPDAERYYKSGGQFLYKRLPFWLASLLDRMLVVVVPLLVLIVPADPGGAGPLPLAGALAHLPLVRGASWPSSARCWPGRGQPTEEREEMQAAGRDRGRGQRDQDAPVVRRPALRAARARRPGPPPPGASTNAARASAPRS